jgi:hypothetical protein
MRAVAGSTPGLDFYLLCELICVSLRLLCLGVHIDINISFHHHFTKTHF